MVGLHNNIQDHKRMLLVEMSCLLFYQIKLACAIVKISHISFSLSPINSPKVGSKVTAEKSPLETTNPLDFSRGFDVVGALFPQHEISSQL